MELLDPSEYDLVVVGTGLIESILAAAAAKAGKTVLQLDPSDRYGGQWASLHLAEFLQLLQSSSQNGTASLHDGDSQNSFPHKPVISGVDIIRPSATTDINDLLGPSSQYNIDLAPKLMYGAGPMIHLLLASGAHHYLEFKLVQGSYIWKDNTMKSVPSSRPEIFRDGNLGPLQKRTLMKFLKGCSDALEGQGALKDCFDDRPLTDLLQRENLDSQLQDSILYGVLRHSNSSRPPSGREALDILKTYGESVGRYGIDTGPYLTPLYGCGELPQAFCRVAAVAGAIQMLRCGIQGLNFDEHTFACNGVELDNGQVIRCSNLAADSNTLSEWLCTFKPSYKTTITHHCVAILNKRLVGNEGQTSFIIPPLSSNGDDLGSQTHPIHGLSLTHATLAAPEGKCILYLWTLAAEQHSSDEQPTQGEEKTAKNILLPALKSLVDIDDPSLQQEQNAETTTDSSSSSKPTSLFAAFYSQSSIELIQSDDTEASSRWPRNTVLCGGSGPEATFVQTVQSSKALFTRLYPEIERFPFQHTSPTAGDDGDAADDSDDEALNALRNALDGLGGSDGAAVADNSTQALAD